ncbi:NADPH oxidase organizer 1b [Chanos chanos]|uniref:NADPH oxidase organizer 1b n=1 Tax=Chanos chanos TaxID=29144 RepID=A0A6J2VFX7_CHACN|nr:NADPH oxidase organizer 1-like [Chanos chanos]
MSDQRYPANVRIIGVMHKDKNKMYITSVLWSDQSEVTVYRSFQEFKKLHKQLKKKFPVENPLRKRERVLPKFKGIGKKPNFQKKGPSKSVHRVKALERYCSELLQCDPSVTLSSEVFQFFLPKEQELQPDFAKNSLMILTSGESPNDLGEGHVYGKRLSVGNVTNPFVTMTCRCIASYETKDVKNRAFRVSVDEVVDVLMKDPAGWWLVENSDKQLAWFPAPYLELVENDEEDDDFDTAVVEGSVFCASRSYTSNKADEISVSIGAVVEVMQKSDNGWWLVRYNGRAGYVPSMYLQPYSGPAFGLRTLQRHVHGSSLNLSTSSSPQPELNQAARPQSLQQRLRNLQKFRSMEVLSETRHQHDTLAPREECDSRKSSISSTSTGTDFSFSSSGSESLVQSDGDQDLRQRSQSQEEDQYSADSGLSSEPHCSAGSDSNVAAKRFAAPKVPPRPQTQEILTRCTTYTRKAAMASRARLFPDRVQIQAH